MRRPPTQLPGIDEEVDPREIDKVITEAAGMTSRWSLFRRFLYDRLKVFSGIFVCVYFLHFDYIFTCHVQ